MMEDMVDMAVVAEEEEEVNMEEEDGVKTKVVMVDMVNKIKITV